LLQAVIDEGFRGLDRALDATARTDDPVADLFGQALASRYLAQANPHLYDLMFGLSTRGSYRAPAALNHVGGHSEGFQAPYSRLVEASTRLVHSGRIRSGEDPESVATQLWSSVHGFITLELADHFARFRNPLNQVLEPMMVNLVVGMGASREEAVASHAAAIATWRRRVRREQARARAARV
ncbi:MAG TPA: TetR-like C-terminal domain-containing protein, partial [Mycobacterium sp.]